MSPFTSVAPAPPAPDAERAAMASATSESARHVICRAESAVLVHGKKENKDTRTPTQKTRCLTGRNPKVCPQRPHGRRKTKQTRWAPVGGTRLGWVRPPLPLSEARPSLSILTGWVESCPAVPWAWPWRVVSLGGGSQGARGRLWTRRGAGARCCPLPVRRGSGWLAGPGWVASTRPRKPVRRSCGGSVSGCAPRLEGGWFGVGWYVARVSMRRAARKRELTGATVSNCEKLVSNNLFVREQATPIERHGSWGAARARMAPAAWPATSPTSIATRWPSARGE